MTRLQKLAIERVIKLIDGLHSEMCVRVPFYIGEKTVEELKAIVAEKDRESSRKWSEDNAAKREAHDLLDALRREGQEPEGND